MITILVGGLNRGNKSWAGSYFDLLARVNLIEY